MQIYGKLFRAVFLSSQATLKTLWSQEKWNYVYGIVKLVNGSKQMFGDLTNK